MTRFVDAIIVYRILRKLTTPFKDTEAYRQGIIDDKGRILKKFSDLNTTAERDAYTLLDRLVWRIKRIIERVPYENKSLASFAAALALIKEHVALDREPLHSEFEGRFFALRESADHELEMQQVTDYFNSQRKSFKMHLEDIANSVHHGFSGQATADPNPNLAGRDIFLGSGKPLKRKKPNVKQVT